jgi:hypothetical protein
LFRNILSKKPSNEINIKDFIQFLRCFTVSKYSPETKNISKIDSALDTFFFVILELLLKVINTVSRVRINPVLVKPIFAISDVIDIKLLSSGSLIYEL